MNPYTEVLPEELKGELTQGTERPVAMVEGDTAVEYVIDGADNPEDNGTFKPTKEGTVERILSPEEIMRRKLRQLKLLHRIVRKQNSLKESARETRARVKKNRRKAKMQKASRKRNRQ